MADASIIVAVIALVAAVVSGVISSFTACSLDAIKRHRETQRVLAKYRDPLLLASVRLHSRIYNIINRKLLSHYREGSEREDLYIVYTAYVIGQYLCWVFILNKKAQFLRFSSSSQLVCFSPSKFNKELNFILEDIAKTFSYHLRDEGRQPLELWRGQQSAIGEIMIDKEESGNPACMGYATFRNKCVVDRDFSYWFEPIMKDLRQLAMVQKDDSQRSQPISERIAERASKIIDDPRKTESVTNIQGTISSIWDDVQPCILEYVEESLGRKRSAYDIKINNHCENGKNRGREHYEGECHGFSLIAIYDEIAKGVSDSLSLLESRTIKDVPPPVFEEIAKGLEKKTQDLSKVSHELPLNRLRRLQHLLLDLIEILDPDRIEEEKMVQQVLEDEDRDKPMERVVPASPRCPCSKCRKYSTLSARDVPGNGESYNCHPV